jgi:hypothetical protein
MIVLLSVSLSDLPEGTTSPRVLLADLPLTTIEPSNIFKFIFFPPKVWRSKYSVPILILPIFPGPRNLEKDQILSIQHEMGLLGS